MSEPPRPIEPPGTFEGLDFRAIVIGVLVDTFATLLTSIVLVVAFTLPEAGAGGEIPAEAIEALSARPDFLLVSLLVGLSCTVLGAYVGASRAGTLHLRHGGWVAVGSALVGLLFHAGAEQASPPPLWFDALGLALMLPAGLLGGLLARRRAPPEARGLPLG